MAKKKKQDKKVKLRTWKTLKMTRFEKNPKEENEYLKAKVEIQSKIIKKLLSSLKKIRNTDWGTDYCNSQNMIADRALEDYNNILK